MTAELTATIPDIALAPSDSYVKFIKDLMAKHEDEMGGVATLAVVAVGVAIGSLTFIALNLYNRFAILDSVYNSNKKASDAAREIEFRVQSAGQNLVTIDAKLGDISRIHYENYNKFNLRLEKMESLVANLGAGIFIPATSPTSRTAKRSTSKTPVISGATGANDDNEL